TGSLVGGVLIVWLYPDQWWLKLTAGSMALFSGILTLPPVFNSVASFVISRKKVAVDLDGLGFATMFRGWGILTLGWIFNGLSLWLILKGMPGIEVRGDDFWLTLASVSLATSAGFISLLPGGLGVRELVMIPLLGARFDPATAVLAAVIIRLVWLIAELLTSGNIFLIRWLKFRSSR
ncbi:MAG: lysylphosphatidylglycerol synthase domain-containing protein, partial [Planctomycetota bacterium]